MNKYIVKLRHMTFKRAVKKLISMAKEIPVRVYAVKVKKVNKDIYERLPEYIGEKCESGQGSYYKKKNIKLGIITDEFMYNYYKDAVELVIVTPENYRQLIDEKAIDMLLYVSCWHGMAGDEWYGDDRHAKIPEVFEYANTHDIKTVFQSIEDPISYERFLPIAKESRYIFTTCKESIDKYKADTNNNNVWLLEYGVNPAFHNPIKAKNAVSDSELKDIVMFAGSWMDIYKDRCKDMRMVFDGVIMSGKQLMIIDRNTDVKLPGYKYPRRYQGFTVPALDHATLQKAHRLFDFNININTVRDSSTMCAMRVYELQALGCLMLSNYAFAVSENFPGLFMINNKEEVQYIVNGYTEEELARMRTDNIRNVMTDKTVYDRLNYIFEKTSIEDRFIRKKVLVICDKKTDNIVHMFENQTYKNKELKSLSEITDDKTVKADYVAYFTDENTYGEDYLTDMMNVFKYSDCNVVTKDDNARMDRSAVAAEIFKLEMIKDNRADGNIFRTDNFSLNERQHITGSEKELAVIVPVYNNGEYLYGRCFRSLLRSSVFDKMTIYLIDDGSTDKDTIRIINKLANRYDNVKTFFFGDGGSGSAARPRNKGVEISDEPYITYLDPDNEAISNGYATLLEEIKDKKCDMAFGSIYARRDADTLSKIGFLFKDELIEDPKKYLIKENFRPQSVQGCVIKRELIDDNDITNVEGGYGEDTLFFYELMLAAKSVYYLNTPIHIYYAERSGSSVNDVGVSFFEKSLPVEKTQAAIFAEKGLADEYKKRRLDYFIVNWYLDKLQGVKNDEDRKICLDITGQITRLYGKDISEYIKKEKDIKN